MKLRLVASILLALIPLSGAHAALAPYTERGKADFDAVIDVVNPLGTWTNVVVKEGKPLFRLCEPAQPPYTHGRWEYTDFGWTWIGAEPGSWALEHYGWWTLEADGKWAWHPDGTWHTAGVDFRRTKEYIGWRPSRLDEAQMFVEKDADRYAKPEEWIWAPAAKFMSPLAPADLIIGSASADAAAKSKDLLLDSQAATHVYSAWRDIDRTGPDPEKILPPERVVAEENRAPNQPNVTGYTLLSLPKPWAPLPPTAQSNQVYLYRPEFYQDIDGIRRRIEKWYTPAASAEQKAQIGQIKQSLQEEAEKKEGAGKK